MPSRIAYIEPLRIEYCHAILDWLILKVISIPAFQKVSVEMRENSEKGGVGSLNYIDTTPIPLDHEIYSSRVHMNSIIRHHLNSDSSATNVKCSGCRHFREIHVYDHILHTERRTITNNNMCCWPFVDVILEDPPPKRRSAARAKRERVVPTAAAEQQDQRMFVSDRLHMHPGVSRIDFFWYQFPPAYTTHFPFPRYNTNPPNQRTSKIIFHLRSIIPPTQNQNERYQLFPWLRSSI